MSAELLNNNGLVSHFGIEQRIFGIRGMQVMIDRDLAQLYGVDVECQDIDNKKMCQHIDKSSLTIE